MNPGLTVSYKAEIPLGVHHESDIYMIALYGESCDLSEFTTQYTKKGEITGEGYRAGGIALENFRVEQDGTAVCFTFNDAHWDRVSVKDVCCGLVYNASKQNRSMGVVVLAQKTSATNGPFDIYFPEPTADTAVFVLD